MPGRNVELTVSIGSCMEQPQIVRRGAHKVYTTAIRLCRFHSLTRSVNLSNIHEFYGAES